MPPLSIDTVMHTTTIAPAPKKMHALPSRLSNLCRQTLSKNQKIRLLPQKKQIDLAHYLEGYDQTLSDLFIEGFKFGFKTPYQGPIHFRLSSNLSSLKGK